MTMFKERDHLFLRNAVALLVLLFSSPAFCQEIHEFYQGVRQLGMGGVGIGVVNDETALLTNPAGLAKLRSPIATLIDPEITLGEHSASIATKGSGLSVMEPQGLLDAANKKPDRYFYGKGQIFPSFVVPHFGLGAFAKYESAGMVNSVTGQFDYFYRNDMAVVMGTNFSFINGLFKVGASVRYINRIEAITSLPSSSTNLNIKSLAAQGSGVAVDVGAIMTLPVAMLPSIALMAHDVGQTRYNVGTGLYHGYNGEPATSLTKVDGALSFFPIFDRGIRGSFSAELRDIFHLETDKDIMRRIHVGAEVNLRDSMFFRAGMHQRCWTLGFELAWSLYQLQFATYGEDVGADGKPQEDRRFSAKMAVRF